MTNSLVVFVPNKLTMTRWCFKVSKCAKYYNEKKLTPSIKIQIKWFQRIRGKKQRANKSWRFDWNIYPSEEAKRAANFLGLALSP